MGRVQLSSRWNIYLLCNIDIVNLVGRLMRVEAGSIIAILVICGCIYRRWVRVGGGRAEGLIRIFVPGVNQRNEDAESVQDFILPFWN